MARTGTIAFGLAALVAGPLGAQVTPQGEIAGFKIAHAQEHGICLAAREAESDAGKAVVYTYYQTYGGQRWQVAGYVKADDLPIDEVTVGLSFDGTELLARATEVRDGDFMFPFQSLAEVEAFEARVGEAEALTVSLAEAGDALILPLEDLRAALAAVQTCLTQLR